MTIDVRRRELLAAEDEDGCQQWALPNPLTLPPIRLPDRAVLAEAAAATPAFDDLRTFVAFVGDGRHLTAKGNLKLADGAALLRLLLGVEDAEEPSRWPRPTGVRSTADLPAVNLLRRWAEAAGLVEVDGRWLRCGERAALVADDPLEAWLAMIMGLLDLGAASHLFLQGELAPHWLDEVDELLALEWLLDLYADGPVPLEELVGQAREEAAALRETSDLDPHVAQLDPDLADLHDLILPGVVRQVIARLEELGAVSVTGITAEPTRWGPVATGGAVALTPLGRWAVNRLVRERIPAPVVGELSGEDAVTLLRACSRLDPDHAAAEFDAWVAARLDADTDADADAVADLVLALRQLAAHEVPAAVLAIDLLGAEAAAAMGRLRDHPRLGPFVAVWLGRHGADDWRPDGPAELSALVDLLDARWRRDGRDAPADEFAALGGSAVQLAIIEQLGHFEHPVAVDVLDALAYGADDGLLAKAARAALSTHPDVSALNPTGSSDATSRP